MTHLRMTPEAFLWPPQTRVCAGEHTDTQTCVHTQVVSTMPYLEDCSTMLPPCLVHTAIASGRQNGPCRCVYCSLSSECGRKSGASCSPMKQGLQAPGRAGGSHTLSLRAVHSMPLSSICTYSNLAPCVIPIWMHSFYFLISGMETRTLLY